MNYKLLRTMILLSDEKPHQITSDVIIVKDDENADDER
jgi:hypothetical protein